MADTTYNGWRNYETWRINLEICDDYVASLELCCKQSPDYREPYEFSKTLEDYVDQALTGFGESETGLALDYARSFVSDVDFLEIAESQLSDIPERCEDHTVTCDECGEVLDENGEYFRIGLCDPCGEETDLEPSGFIRTSPDVDDRAHDATIAAQQEDWPN